MNKWIGIGRLTRDPDVRYSQGTEVKAIANLTIAVDRGTAEGADFPNIVAFGKQGEFAEKYLHKGMKIAVEGSIHTDSYTNKDGVKVYTTNVIAQRFEFVESKTEQKPQESYMRTDGDGFMNVPEGIDEDELPFARR